MLKNILNLKGVVQLNREQQKSINGGAFAYVKCKPSGGQGMVKFSGPVESFEEAEELANQYCTNGAASIIISG